MKKRLFILSCVIILVNFVLAFLLSRESIVERIDLIAFFIGSYIVYWVMNIYLYIQIKIKNALGYSLTMIVGLIVSIVAFIVLIFNLITDKAIYIPLMYVISMLVTFLNWFIFDRKNLKKILKRLI
jgi:hypothetical protein